MSCSTYTVRSTSLGGKPSSLPLAMERISVDCREENQIASHEPISKPGVYPAQLHHACSKPCTAAEASR